MGEVMMRGNIVMKGYLKNPRATEQTFRGGWFQSGDLAVNHGNGRIELKDRSKGNLRTTMPPSLMSGLMSDRSIDLQTSSYPEERTSPPSRWRTSC